MSFENEEDIDNYYKHVMNDHSSQERYEICGCSAELLVISLKRVCDLLL
jgi:hypothetical protein